MRIIFVRHGITEANKTRTFSKPDTRISQDGFSVLDRTKEFLKKFKIDKVYTSKLIRTQESAEYLGYNHYIKDDRINEIDVGDFKGLNYDFVLEKFSENMDKIKNDPFNFKYPNGESRMDVIKRVCNFLDDVSNEDGNILCFSHGIAIRSALFWLLKDLSNYDNFWIDNGSLTIFKVENNKKIIEGLNII